MKERCIYTCVICFLNICVFLYAVSNLLFTIFDVIIELQIINVTCTNSSIPSLFLNESEYCTDFTILLFSNIIFIIPGGVICYIIWLIVNILFFTNRPNINKILSQIKSENESLQTKLTDITLEITNLERQLANRRTDRGTAREDTY